MDKNHNYKEGFSVNFSVTENLVRDMDKLKSK